MANPIKPIADEHFEEEAYPSAPAELIALLREKRLTIRQFLASRWGVTHADAVSEELPKNGESIHQQ